MDEILEILSDNGRLSAEEIATLTGRTPAAVKKAIRKYETDGTIVAYKAVINSEKVREQKNLVRALIEVGVAPQKDVGFDSIAERIYQFPEVTSCYLLSGSYDLLLVVEGKDLHTVANFVASKLSPMEHVRNTRTHFLLKKYKEDGRILHKQEENHRLQIAP